MKKTFTRIEGDAWCSVDIKLEEGSFSMTGSEGVIVTEEEAGKIALKYWESFFEEDIGELAKVNKEHNKRFSSAKSAAKFVLEVDGKYHGLNVDKEEEGKVYILSSCGQIRETIARFFPELFCLFPYHLNDMRGGCEHQDALQMFQFPIENKCRICGYLYDSKWLTFELPNDVVRYIENINL